MGFNIEGFADDHQVYRSFSPAFQLNVLTNDIMRCFSVISAWMKKYFLHLNSSKTEIILLGPTHILNEMSIGGVTLDGDNCIRFHPTAKNLGFTFDRLLKCDAQVNSVIRSCNGSLRQIYRLRYFLSRSQLIMLCNAYILSKLDYANSLYFGIDTHLINRLQSVQNSAAKFIFGRNRFDHASDIISKLHWLRIQERIYFKILLTVFKCVHGTAPKYLCDLIHILIPHNLVLTIPMTNSKYGDRAFHKSGPKLWNALPTRIRLAKSVNTFKKHVKHYLFNFSAEFNQNIGVC